MQNKRCRVKVKLLLKMEEENLVFTSCQFLYVHSACGNQKDQIIPNKKSVCEQKIEFVAFIYGISQKSSAALPCDFCFM